MLVSNPTDFPDVGDPASKVKEVQEPIVKASIIVPDGQLIRLRASMPAAHDFGSVQITLGK